MLEFRANTVISPSGKTQSVLELMSSHFREKSKIICVIWPIPKHLLSVPQNKSINNFFPFNVSLFSILLQILYSIQWQIQTGVSYAYHRWPLKIHQLTKYEFPNLQKSQGHSLCKIILLRMHSWPGARLHVCLETEYVFLWQCALRWVKVHFSQTSKLASLHWGSVKHQHLSPTNNK